MRKNFLIILMITLLLLLIGCANTANEKKLKSDLESDTRFGLLKEGENIEEIAIEKRQTDKGQKTDTIWCTVTTADEEVLYQKEVILTYGLYDKGGWVLDDVMVNASSQWTQTPLKGIGEENIAASLRGQVINVDGEEWEITDKNIKDISIDRHDTELDKKTDVVTASLLLSEEVEEAKGELIISYIFDDGWKVEAISVNEEFAVSMKPEAALEVTNEDLAAKLAEQEFQLESEKKDGITVVTAYNTNLHTVTINESEISDFKIETQESLSKGTKQIYHCSCTLNKLYAVFHLKASASYYYNSSGEWELQNITIVPECTSVDLEGEWMGSYNDTPFGGDAVLNITDADENGMITAVYSYFPSEKDKYTEPGSYHVSGKIDMTTLDISLTAGEWIVEPSNAYSWTKTDILATFCVDEAAIKGVGQESKPFDVTRQKI